MKTNYSKLATVLLILFVYCGMAMSQQNYAVITAVSSVSIKGTSTLHPWSMEGHDLTCNTNADIKKTNLNKITDVNFSCKVDKLTSTEGSSMDAKAHEALKSDKFPLITFKSQDITGLVITDDKFTGNLTGLLTIAGNSKIVNIPFSGKVVNDNHWNVKGSVKIKMTDFHVDPPTAFLGAMKTGDEVTLNYTFDFNKSHELSESK